MTDEQFSKNKLSRAFQIVRGEVVLNRFKYSPRNTDTALSELSEFFSAEGPLI